MEPWRAPNAVCEGASGATVAPSSACNFGWMSPHHARGAPTRVCDPHAEAMAAQSADGVLDPMSDVKPTHAVAPPTNDSLAEIVDTVRQLSCDPGAWGG